MQNMLYVLYLLAAYLLFLKAGKPMNKCQCLIDCCDYNWSLHIVVTVMNRNKVCRMNLHR